MWNSVHFSNCVLLGKLSCIAFGDFFEVSSEVIVQRFFNLERDHFGGSGHAAALNLGDCFAYALARTSGEPLLFKGRDFMHTGIPVATS